MPANRLTDSGERTVYPPGAGALACYDWRPRQSIGELQFKRSSRYAFAGFAARARQTAREARAVPKDLEADLLGLLRLDPAAQVIRQRGVHPIAARA